MKGGRHADRPNLRHLRTQARDLLKVGAAPSVTGAQCQIARLYDERPGEVVECAALGYVLRFAQDKAGTMPSCESAPRWSDVCFDLSC
jgi:hypothetical protein